MKECKICKCIKDESEFYTRVYKGIRRLRSDCKLCSNKPQNKEQRREYRNKNIERIKKRDNQYYRDNHNIKLLKDIRYRCKRDGILCTLNRYDIIVPNVCPILGILIEAGHSDRNHWPSVDRINPNGGYTPDNIIVISYKANRLKSETSSQERKSLINFYNSLQSTNSYEDNLV